MTSSLLSIDTKCDRVEIGRLLSHLAPADRIAFLRWCITQLPKGKLPPPVPYGYREPLAQAHRSDEYDARLTRMVYCDLLSLLSTYHMDASVLVLELERRGRRGR